MSRPSDWWVLGLTSDPTPGSPDDVARLARSLGEFADRAEGAHRTVLRMRDDDAVLAWAGLSRDTFRERFGEFPAQLAKVHAAHRMAAEALTAFAPRLRAAQAEADRALAAGRDARRRLAGGPDPDPDQLRQALRDVQVVQRAAVEPEAHRAWDAARNLAEQARRLRNDAAVACARAVDVASDAAVQPREFWDKLADAFTLLWDVVHEVAKWVALVAGAVALLVGGPAAWLALGAGTLLLVGAAARGDRGALFDLVLGILGRVPGVRGRGTPDRPAMPTVLGEAERASMRNVLAELRPSHPVTVEVATIRTGPATTGAGFVRYSETDLAWPLALTRTHRSDARPGRFFGVHWASTLDQRIEVRDGGVELLTEDGAVLSYPEPDGAGPPLCRTGDGGFVVTDRPAGRQCWFAAPDDTGVAHLSAVTSGADRIDIARDADGVPTELVRSDGTRVTVGAVDGLITALHVTGDDGRPVLVREFDYDDERRLVGVVNGSGLATAYGYDPAGRLVRWVDRAGTWYAYRYDAAGRCVHTTGPDGYLDHRYEYRPHQIRFIDSLGHRTTLRLDDVGQVVAVVDPLGRTAPAHRPPVPNPPPVGAGPPIGDATYRYEPDGRLLARTGPDAQGERRAYDAEGNLVEIVDRHGDRTVLEYGPFRRLRTRTGPSGAQTRFTWDTELRLTSVTDEQGRRRTYEYDAVGRLVRERDADHRVHTYEYDGRTDQPDLRGTG
jgi:YD repeat-containing protein